MKFVHPESLIHAQWLSLSFAFYQAEGCIGPVAGIAETIIVAEKMILGDVYDGSGRKKVPVMIWTTGVNLVMTVMDVTVRGEQDLVDFAINRFFPAHRTE